MALYKQPGSENWWISVYRGQGMKRLRVSSKTTDKDRALALEATLKMAHRGTVSRDRLIGIIDDLMDHEPAPSIPLHDKEDGMEAVYFGLPEVTDLQPSTLKHLRTNVRRWLRWMASNWPSVETVADVSRQAVIQFCDELRGSDIKRKTFNNVRSDLQTAFERLTYRAGLQENVWKVVPNLKTTDSVSGRAFTLEEETAILEAAKAFEHGEWYGASIFAKYTGLRQIDLVNLQVRDLEGDRLRVITPSKTQRHGVKILMPLHSSLQAWVADQTFSGKWAFPTLHHRHPIARYSGEFTTVLKNGGLDPESDPAYLSFHCWRHTFRTRLEEKRVKKKTAQLLGGWTTDISERYNHADLYPDLRQAIDVLDPL